MRGLNLRTVIDRGLLAAAVIGGGLYANRMTVPASEPIEVTFHSNVRCSGERRLPPKVGRADMFVPAAPNEPMESLEN